MSFQESFIFGFSLWCLNDSCFGQSGSKFVGQEFVAAQPIETKDFVFQNTINENAQSWQGSNAEPFNKERRLLSVDRQELRVGELLAENFEMFIHDLTPEEFFVEEVDNSELKLGDIV